MCLLLRVLGVLSQVWGVKEDPCRALTGSCVPLRSSYLFPWALSTYHIYASGKFFPAFVGSGRELSLPC